MQPLNHSYLPNLEEHVARAADPFYDRGSRYTVPYVVWHDGIGWRNDKVKEDIAGMDVPWDIFWQAQAYRGKVGILDDRRDALSMPMQRDAMRAGRPARPEHRGSRLIIQGGGRLPQLRGICNRRSRSPTTRRCPRGRRCCTTRGRATCSAAPSTTCRRGQARRPLLLGPAGERRRPERLPLHRPRGEEPGARAPASSTTCSTRRTPTNFVNFTGYTPPQNAIDAESLIKQEPDSGEPRARVVRPDQFAANQELLQLSVRAQRLWDDAWAKFKAG